MAAIRCARRGRTQGLDGARTAREDREATVRLDIDRG